MADALCGPSNPLQQFKQQTQLDRSLQQDRLASRQHPTQGFRSPDLHAGLLDPAFEAFQAGLEPPALDYAPPFQHPTDFQNASPTPAWAADFQRLNISSPPAISRPQQQYTPASSTANWAQGFREHLAQAAPKQQISSYSPSSFQQRARYGLSGFQSSFAQHTNAPSFQAKGKEPAVERFDEAAFERAFDQARDDMMADAGRQDETSVETTLNHAEETVIQGMSDDDFVREEFMKVFAKERETTTTLNEEQKKEQDQRAEDDALAATAKELLEKVEHNHSEKFRNSQFLGLMRKLRDREVRVEGDKMVETTTAATSTATIVTDDSLNASSTATSSSQFHPDGRRAVIDTRPPEYIPPHEQDHDTGRVNPQDGQEVVDLLDQPGALTDDIDAEFMMTSPFYQP